MNNRFRFEFSVNVLELSTLNAIVAQSKNFPFGVTTTIELKNMTTTSDKRTG